MDELSISVNMRWLKPAEIKRLHHQLEQICKKAESITPQARFKLTYTPAKQVMLRMNEQLAYYILSDLSRLPVLNPHVSASEDVSPPDWFMNL